jgi:hypothetical protein
MADRGHYMLQSGFGAKSPCAQRDFTMNSPCADQENTVKTTVSHFVEDLLQ